jgi:hypothetical protein
VAVGVPEGLLVGTDPTAFHVVRVYAAAGFRDLGRFVEYVPAGLIRSG